MGEDRLTLALAIPELDFCKAINVEPHFTIKKILDRLKSKKIVQFELSLVVWQRQRYGHGLGYTERVLDIQSAASILEIGISTGDRIVLLRSNAELDNGLPSDYLIETNSQSILNSCTRDFSIDNNSMSTASVLTTITSSKIRIDEDVVKSLVIESEAKSMVNYEKSESEKSKHFPSINSLPSTSEALAQIYTTELSGESFHLITQTLQGKYETDQRDSHEPGFKSYESAINDDLKKNAMFDKEDHSENSKSFKIDLTCQSNSKNYNSFAMNGALESDGIHILNQETTIKDNENNSFIPNIDGKVLGTEFAKKSPKDGLFTQINSLINKNIENENPVVGKTGKSWFKKLTRGYFKSNNIVFGVPLESLSSIHKTDEGVPLLLVKALDYIINNSVRQEGIFRISGSASRITALRQGIDEGQVNITFQCANDAAGIIKLYLRELPNPLIYGDCFDLLVSICGVFESGNQCVTNVNTPNSKVFVNINVRPKDEILNLKINMIKASIDHTLPKCHSSTLKFLIYNLRKILLEKEHNRMDANNLATIFAPNVGPYMAIGVFKNLLLYYDQIFSNNLKDPIFRVARVLYDFGGEEEGELPMEAHQLCLVEASSTLEGWLDAYCIKDGLLKFGSCPSNYISIIGDETLHLTDDLLIESNSGYPELEKRVIELEDTVSRLKIEFCNLQSERS